MKLKTLENIWATNESLRNRQYTIIGLTADEIPIRMRPAIQNFLENSILDTRNFVPGDLGHTISLFNDINGANVQSDEPILMLALQRKATVDSEFLPDTYEPLQEWIEAKSKAAQEAIQTEAAMGPVLCLPEFCPYQSNIRRPNHESEQQLAEKDAKLEALRSICNNIKHLMQRLLTSDGQHQRMVDKTTNEILNLLYQAED